MKGYFRVSNISLTSCAKKFLISNVLGQKKLTHDRHLNEKMDQDRALHLFVSPSCLVYCFLCTVHRNISRLDAGIYSELQCLLLSLFSQTEVTNGLNYRGNTSL